MSAKESNIVGILVGGGPAPGLNMVISAVTIYARKLEYRVFAIHDGYLHLATGDKEEVEKNMEELNEDMVGPIQNDGGSIIRPHRFDPAKDPESIHRTLYMLMHFKIGRLIIIGGNDKIATTHLITQGIDPYNMQVVAIPKTIDNDIQLPIGQTTFGFHTARKFCSDLVKNLMQDARSAPRWFIVETMGRNSGHLALSVAEASGAQCCIIPEDFKACGVPVTIDTICDIFMGAILKRFLAGKRYGVAVITEGLINSLPKEDLTNLFENGVVKMNEDGTINLDEAEISRAIKIRMEARLKDLGLGIRINPKKIGYELRCEKPVSFDAGYCKELGFAAVNAFVEGHSNCMVVWEGGIITFRSFRSMMDEHDGHIYPRLVDVSSQEYRIAREYGWQVKERDLNDPEKVEALSKLAKLTPEEFVAKYESISDKI